MEKIKDMKAYLNSHKSDYIRIADDFYDKIMSGSAWLDMFEKYEEYYCFDYAEVKEKTAADYYDILIERI